MARLPVGFGLHDNTSPWRTRLRSDGAWYRHAPPHWLMSFGLSPTGREAIPITWTPCHFGGQRPWFRCPGCSRHDAIVHRAGPAFRCRHCHDLAYASTREDRMDRLVRAAEKLRARLGERMGIVDPFPEPLKGMQRRAYERLRWERHETEVTMWSAVGEWLNRRDSRADHC